jgi:hypothetical protein
MKLLEQSLTALLGTLAFLGGCVLLASDTPERGVGLLLIALIFAITVLIGHLAQHTSRLIQIESQLIQMNDRQYKMAKWEVRQRRNVPPES